ncbi:MAG TPA: DUF4131 domain-containing protein, partial [Candidatus Hydrogenedentes bacterium]|nr:DUF4131 domain-containing protein [Candidatus Hydrogenedentota bacterium]
MAREETLLESMPKQALNRHWVWIALWYAAGIFWAHRLPWAVWLLGPLFGLVGAAVLLFPVRLPRRSHWGIALLCLGLGMALYSLRMPKSTPDTLGQYALSYPRGRHAFEGVVKTSAIHIAGDEYTTFTLQVDRAFKGAETVPILGR